MSSRAIRENNLPVETVVGISTDKACKPINVMGMTKALQERVLIEANRDCPDYQFYVCSVWQCDCFTRFDCSSICRTSTEKSADDRYLGRDDALFIKFNKAVDTVFAAIIDGKRGETFVPKVAAARIDVARH